MNYAVILSGGIGTRMGNDSVPKQYLEVNGKPIIIYTLERFERNKDIDSIIVVVAEEYVKQILTWVSQYNISKFAKIALAGATRQESVLSGLEACSTFTIDENDKVIVHDAVRPLVSNSLISACLEKLEDYQGCMPVLTMHDTVYQSIDKIVISGLLDRDTLFAGQTPEAFRLQQYLEANRSVSKAELACLRGTSEIAYKCGMTVCLIPGEDMNFKLTTPADLERFKIVLGND